MNALVKFALVPFIAYFATLIFVAILGSFMDIRELKELLGGTSAMPIWLAWCTLFAIGLIIKEKK